MARHVRTGEPVDIVFKVGPRKGELRPHGELGTYRAGCGCPPCTEANTLYFRKVTGAKPRAPRPPESERVVLDFGRDSEFAPCEEIRNSAGELVRHGKASTYSRHGCRGTACREANAEAQRRYRGGGRRRKRRHGTRSGYVAGCRCDPCTAAAVRYEVDRRAAKRFEQEHGYPLNPEWENW